MAKNKPRIYGASRKICLCKYLGEGGEGSLLAGTVTLTPVVAVSDKSQQR